VSEGKRQSLKTSRLGENGGERGKMATNASVKGWSLRQNWVGMVSNTMGGRNGAIGTSLSFSEIYYQKKIIRKLDRRKDFFAQDCMKGRKRG